MADMCYTCVAFYSKNIEEIMHFKKNLNIASENSTEETWSILMAKQLDIWDDSLADEEVYIYSGDICDIYDIETIKIHGEEYFKFMVVQESRYSPETAIWRELINKYYKNVKYVYSAECCDYVHINTDKEGVIFSERYSVEVENEDTQYFNTEQELICYLVEYDSAFEKCCSFVEAQEIAEFLVDSGKYAYLDIYEFDLGGYGNYE